MVLVVALASVAAFAVALFQKLGALLGIMPLHEVGIDTQLGFGYIVASLQQVGDLILGDKVGLCRGETLYRLILLFYRR